MPYLNPYQNAQSLIDKVMDSETDKKFNKDYTYKSRLQYFMSQGLRCNNSASVTVIDRYIDRR